MAQSKTLTGKTKTVTATVEAIEAASRTLTLKQQDGTYVETVVPADVKRFSEIKVGDTITARYYENLVLRVKRPGEKDVDTGMKSTTPAAGSAAAGTRAKQRTITATITAIDQTVPSTTFTGPNGWKYLVPRRGHECPGGREGRRQGRHHLDRGDAGLGRPRQEIARTRRRHR